MKKAPPSMDDVIVHLEKLPNLKNHSIMVSRTNPKSSRALSSIEGVEAVESYLVVILREKRKRK